MSTPNLEYLVPMAKPQGTSFRFGTVTQASPPRVRLDNDTVDQPVESPGGPLLVGTRVWCQRVKTRLLVVAAMTADVIREVNLVEFTSSGLYTPPSNLVLAEVWIVGGGGGGGGAHATGAGQTSAGNGGGGAGTVIAHLTPAQIGASQSVTIASGGTGGDVAGGDGGDSTLGSILTATGGSGAGSRGPTTSSYSRGGVAGTPGNGSATVDAQIIRGEYGQGGMGIGGENWAQGGRGGNSAMGFGPLPSGTINTGSVAGGALQTRGQGGSGAVNTNSQGSAIDGAPGEDGYCLVREFLS